MDSGHGWVEKFHPTQLVVAQSELAILQRMLRELHVAGDAVDVSPALRLARIKGLVGVDAAASALLGDPRIGPALHRHRADREKALAEQKAHGAAGQLSDLARLIKGLRLRFAAHYPGWQIIIGKNYRPSLVKGYPHVGGGGEGAPTPTDRAVHQGR